MAGQFKTACFSFCTTMFTMAAFVLLFAGSYGCGFVKFTSVDGVANPPLSRYFGLWSWQYWALVTVAGEGTYVVETCHNYPSSMDQDASFKAARAFSVITWIFAIVVLICGCVWGTTNTELKGASLGRLAPLLFVTGIFQGLSLLFLNSSVCTDNKLIELGTVVRYQDTCSLASGAKCIISATVFWFVAAFSSYMEKKAAEAEGVISTEDEGLDEPLNP